MDQPGDRRRAGLELGEILGVADHRLFFKVAHQAVRRAARHEVEHEEAEVKNPLRQQDEPAFQRGGLSHLDEGHEVHALVLGLFHQRADPAVVVDAGEVEFISALVGELAEGGEVGQVAGEQTFGERADDGKGGHLGHEPDMLSALRVRVRSTR